ncbi:hypothetical protein QOZ80_UnG0723320 [Eleusine coracana subsp. coracana]|uniref:Transposase (putative) gypsy type domain-containing protein n=1 Tax=Eleusine coracana subsp. coracana TaxID=191504 RepID=A0AAV9G3W6_ELECO|nr:hypothetical protein QOZ80_UnG0723320 [Eleusine coracana subsp. coracana]
MVVDGILLEQVRIDWKVPCESCPIPIHKQIIMLSSFFEHGFGVPCCSFLHELLFFYGTELVNLNPNSILHITIFVHMCEAFLGTLPHFNLFRRLFVLRPLPKNENQVAIGGGVFQLRKKEAYINVLLKTGNKNWKDDWFYCDNPLPVLANFTSAKATPLAQWTEKPDPTNPQVVALLKKIADLKAEGVDRITIAKSFIVHRVQPLKLQSYPAWDYVNDDAERFWILMYPFLRSLRPIPRDRIMLRSRSRLALESQALLQSDDEEVSSVDVSQLTPTPSDRPSSQSEPPSQTQSDAGVVEQTDKASNSSRKRKETDSQSTSLKKRLCRIKLKKAPSPHHNSLRSMSLHLLTKKIYALVERNQARVEYLEAETFVTGHQLSKAQKEIDKLQTDQREMIKALNQGRADIAARDQKIADLEKLTSNQQRFVNTLNAENENLSKSVKDHKAEMTRL